MHDLTYKQKYFLNLSLQMQKQQASLSLDSHAVRSSKQCHERIRTSVEFVHAISKRNIYSKVQVLRLSLD